MSKQDLNKLKIKVELRELALLASTRGTYIDGSDDDPKYMLDLLKWASSHHDNKVLDHLGKIESYLSPVHKRFFANNGINFSNLKTDKDKDQGKSYRGIANDGTNDKPAPAGEQKHKGKRKVTYRGQETWI